MQHIKYFPVFCLIILTAPHRAGGQYSATPLKTDTYYFISNKSMPNDQVIHYSVEGKNFSMQNAMYKLRFVQEGGYWKYIPESRNYIWINSSSANQYKIQLLINGKFWALSSTADAIPLLTEVSNTDVYQNWEVDAQSDGFYKITNTGLKNANSPFPNLFVDANKNSLFLAQWEEAKSFNGRWFLIMAGTISTNDGNDRFDNRRLILTSASTNKNMCLKYMWTSDATGVDYIGNCDDNVQSRFIFQKAINSFYFIKIETNQNGQVYSYYLNDQMKTARPEEVDILTPNPNLSWNVSDLGNNSFMITNYATGMVFEMVKGYYNRNSQGGWGSSVPDQVELRRWDGKYEQRWFLRE